jgi:hypothetical protein
VRGLYSSVVLRPFDATSSNDYFCGRAVSLHLPLPESGVETYTAHSGNSAPLHLAVQIQRGLSAAEEFHASFSCRFTADIHESLGLKELPCAMSKMRNGIHSRLA